MIKTIKSMADKAIKYLIVTHNHPDHAIAFKSIKGIRIISIKAR